MDPKFNEVADLILSQYGNLLNVLEIDRSQLGTRDANLYDLLNSPMVSRVNKVQGLPPAAPGCSAESWNRRAGALFELGRIPKLLNTNPALTTLLQTLSLIAKEIEENGSRQDYDRHLGLVRMRAISWDSPEVPPLPLPQPQPDPEPEPHDEPRRRFKWTRTTTMVSVVLVAVAITIGTLWQLGNFRFLKGNEPWTVAFVKSGSIGIYDGNSGRLIKQVPIQESVGRAVASNDGRYLLTIMNRAVKLWNIETGKVEHVFEQHTGSVNTAVFSADGDLVVTSSQDGSVRLWDRASGRPLQSLMHSSAVKEAVLSLDGRWLASVTQDGKLGIWSTASWERIHYRAIHSSVVRAVSFSPNSEFVVTGSDDKTAIVWRVATGEVLKIFRHGDWVLDVAFSPDGSHVLTGGLDGRARMWSIEVGQPVHEFVHTRRVSQVCFSPSGHRILTRTGNHFIVWDSTEKSLIIEGDL